jgi:hypothetical protein
VRPTDRFAGVMPGVVTMMAVPTEVGAQSIARGQRR